MATEKEAPDYEQAAQDLRAIIAERGIRCESFAHGPYGETGPQRFTCTLSAKRSDLRLVANWRAGSAVALHAFVKATDEEQRQWIRRGAVMANTIGSNRAAFVKACEAFRCSVHDAPLRVCVRAGYRPEAADVLASLLTDDASIAGKLDWLEWADEFGALDNAKPQALRELRAAFAQVQERAAPLRAMFGDAFERAQDCAGRL